MIKTVKTTPYNDQKMGTAGLRRKSKVVMQPNYVENFMQSIFNTIGSLNGKTFLLGGDGRFYNDIAIQKIIKMAAANGVSKLIIGQNGYVSTPAGSRIILKNKLNGGFVLSASHNPGGINGDFGIKYANETGGQIPSAVSDRIYQETQKISEYKIFEADDIKLDKIGRQKLGDMEIEIIDPLNDYVEMMENIFDFSALKKLFAQNHIAVTVAVVSGAKVRRIVRIHNGKQFLGVEQVGIRMQAAEVRQRFGIDDGAFGRAENIFKNADGIGAGYGVHGVELHGEAAFEKFF